MTFPIKMNTPQYALTIPSTKEKHSFRPFLVGEQKSMLLALATDDIDTIVNAIKLLINTCSNGKVDSNKLASFDLEYLFLQLRSRSIGENVSLNTKCNTCANQISFKVDISAAEVDFSTNIEPKIQLTDDIGVKMRYPTLAENIKLFETKNKDSEILVQTVARCVEMVWDANEMVDTSDYTEAQIMGFLETLTVDQMTRITNFILLMPAVRILKEIKCPHCQAENRVLIEGLENFFG